MEKWRSEEVEEAKKKWWSRPSVNESAEVHTPILVGLAGLGFFLRLELLALVACLLCWVRGSTLP